MLLVSFNRGELKKAFPDILTFGVISLSFLLLFVTYGATYDLDQFLSILKSNGSRFYGIGTNIFFELLTSTKITHYLVDGWFLSGWLAAFMLLIKSRYDESKYLNFITIPIIGYLVTFFIFGSESYGWYRFPFQPFLYAAAAIVLANAFKNYPDYLPAFFILLIPIGVSFSKLINIVNFQEYAFFWRWGVSGLILLFMCGWIVRPMTKKVNFTLNIILFGIFAAAIALNLASFYQITPDYWRGAV